MSDYWENKWATAGQNWEDKRSKEDSSEEILEGLKQTPGGLGLKRPDKASKMLDGGFNIGRSVDLTVGVGGETARVSILDLQSDDEGSRGITINLAAFRPDVTVNEPSDIVAEVQWGSGGVQANAEVDYVHGSVFTVFGSFVRVNAMMEGDPGDTAKVAAFAAYGVHPGGFLQPQRTVIKNVDGDPFGVILPGASSALIAIPRFASAVQFVQTSSIGGVSAELPYRLAFFRLGGASTAIYVYGNLNTGSEHRTGIPAQFPNGSRLMSIQNLDAAETIVDARLIFNLAL